MGSLFWITILTILLAAAIWISVLFSHWKRAALARLRDGARIVQTSAGPIECAILGEGPAILISHGVLGGYDQGLAGVASGFCGGRSYRFIAVSRPGYLRTAPEIGKTPEEQADAFAALLDALNIEKAVVAGISGGGSPAMQFALRHADRCAALLLISAATECVPVAQPGARVLFLRALMQMDFLSWCVLALARRLPRLVFHSILSRDELRRMRDSRVRANLLRILDSTAPFTARRPGCMIDGNSLASLAPLPLSSIRVPALAVHGTSDAIVPFASIERTAAVIPGARLIPIQNGSHFACVLGSESLSAEVNRFLDKELR